MPVQVVKKERESSQSLAHRFTKTVRQSGVLLEIRKGQYHKRTKSALAQKRSALRRAEVKAQKAKEAKLAKPR